MWLVKICCNFLFYSLLIVVSANHLTSSSCYLCEGEGAQYQTPSISYWWLLCKWTRHGCLHYVIKPAVSSDKCYVNRLLLPNDKHYVNGLPLSPDKCSCEQVTFTTWQMFLSIFFILISWKRKTRICWNASLSLLPRALSRFVVVLTWEPVSNAIFTNTIRSHLWCWCRSVLLMLM